MTEPRVKAIPEGMHTITPHIVVRDAARAAEWYAAAPDAEERSRILVSGGKLMSVELWFGDSAVMVADEFPEMGVLSPHSVGGTSTVLTLYVEDVDALWERAVGAGAEVLHPLGDTFRGDRHGQITDPFGHRCGLAQHMRNIPSEEIIRAAAEAFGGQAFTCGSVYELVVWTGIRRRALLQRLRTPLYPGSGSEEPQSGHPRSFSRAICVARPFCWSESLALLSTASI